MKLVNLRTQAVEDVPDEQVHDKFAAGTHGFLKDQLVPVKAEDGTYGTVPAAEYQEAVKHGATLAGADEFRHAQREAKYGGVGGAIGAGAAGLVRGASVGLSDPLAIGAAGVFGGRSAEEATREALAGMKEAHPYISAGTEITGAALPVLASGGAAAPEVAAAEGAGEAAAGGGALSTLLRVVGTPARGVGALGHAAEAAVEPLARIPGAGSALGRIAAAGVRSGAAGTAEGAAFGVGNQISEDALGDHDMTAEKFVAAAGHGALYGMMLGTGAGALGAGAKEAAGGVLSRIGPSLERQGRLEAARAVGANKAIVREAEARAGGLDALGGTVQKFELLGKTAREAAQSGPEEILARTKAAQEKVWGEMSAALDTAGAKVKPTEVLEKLEKYAAEAESTAAGKGAGKLLRSYMSDLAESFASRATQPTAAPVARTARSPAEVAEILRTDESAAKEMAATGKLPERVAFAGGAPAAVGGMPETVPISVLHDEKSALGAKIFGPVGTRNPPEHIQALQSFYGDLMGLEEKAINEASAETGGAEGTRLRELSKDYQRLKLIEKSSIDLQARRGANAHLSLTAKIMGASHLAGALAAGHPVTAAGAILTAYGTKLVQEHGAAVSSVALGKLAKIDMLARASNSVDRDLAEAAKGFVTGEAGPRIRLRHFGQPSGDTLEDRYKKAKEAVANYAPFPDTRLEHVNRVSPGLVDHAPKTSLAISNVVGNGAAFLANAVPKAQGTPSLLAPEPRPTQAQMATFVRQFDAVDNPVQALLHMAETGKIHRDQIDAIRQTKPRLFAQFQGQVLKEVSEHRKDLNYDRVLAMSKLTQQPLDPTLSAAAVTWLQGTYKPLPPPPGMGAPGQGAPKRKLEGFSKAASLHSGHVDGGA